MKNIKRVFINKLLNNIENSNIGKDNSESLNTCIREKLKLIS